MSAFAAALDTLFEDPNLATVGMFASEGHPAFAVHVIARRPDRIVTFGDARLASDSTLFDLRVSEVANPRPGDRLTIGTDHYVLFGEPVRDAERLVWTVSAVLQ
ncbi:MAG: hypothetical protein INR68_05440 [Methylobacterium mesophilicum]|nr:hypothetical protein [Methylobacterium mesophilicum]